MTRFAGFILLFVSLYGCAAQQVYNNHVYMENRCGQPLEIKVSNSSNMHSLERNLTVAAGARALVASFASYGEDVIEQIPSNYQLTLHDAAGSKTLDAAQLKQHLAAVEKVTEGTQREWTISEASVCP
ncbi:MULTISPECIES: hypothetical protein [Pseudomonas]|jgi:hypothetical protein|uniref:Lipoprotein n=1 Tax=Pseudomonas fluorescens R124 TaxID=743713 RepID=A0A7U9GWA2_PSEFL|nr:MULTISPECIES: hypothetical protein [Pseudomonas]EJZ60805.1 hypothetical protein I1A_005170 [Pseudomonas fluorescens R124]MBK5341273.1 hypothetical protein [Pseudomonas sp. TH49]RBC02436.1 hypothetical protein C3E97_006595 [Pseudomonas sp. MWU12-2115]RBL69409.1 hypothetical protein C3E98_020325 [Pseudomonas sp. MWU13-2625]